MVKALGKSIRVDCSMMSKVLQSMFCLAQIHELLDPTTRELYQKSRTLIVLDYSTQNRPEDKIYGSRSTNLHKSKTNLPRDTFTCSVGCLLQCL